MAARIRLAGIAERQPGYSGSTKIFSSLLDLWSRSLARGDAGVVVTGYERACLRGLPLDERIGRVISIAHPDDREALERDARTIAGRRAEG